MHVAKSDLSDQSCGGYTPICQCSLVNRPVFLIKTVDVLETFDTYNAAWAYAQTLDVEFEIEFIPHHLEHEVPSTKPPQSDHD